MNRNNGNELSSDPQRIDTDRVPDAYAKPGSARAEPGQCRRLDRRQTPVTPQRQEGPDEGQPLAVAA